MEGLRMSVVAPLAPSLPRTDPVAGGPPSRDRAIDVVRAASLVVVVLLHGLMAGIWVEGGQIRIVNAVEGQDWFAPVSWFVQVMPLFFLAGGVAAATQWRRVRPRGTTAWQFAAGRVRRLALPAAVAFGVIAAVLTVAALAGTSADLLADIGWRLAQPMWFLAVYVGASALVPLLHRAHERAPWLTLGLLAAAAFGVDMAGMASGASALGILNLAFVWLAMQQLGFFWADGWFRSLTPERLIAGVVGCVGALAVLVGMGYSPDMYVNLNPPTVALVVLGAAQTLVVAALAPRLTRALDRSAALSAVVDAIGARSMSIYLWHMSALVMVALGMLWIDASFPTPLTVDWWITRPLWLAAVTAAVVPLALVAGRLEARRTAPRAEERARTVAAVVVATASVCVVLLSGFALWGAWAGAMGVTLAYGLAGGPLPIGRRRIRRASRAATRTRP